MVQVQCIPIKTLQFQIQETEAQLGEAEEIYRCFPLYCRQEKWCIRGFLRLESC